MTDMLHKRGVNGEEGRARVVDRMRGLSLFFILLANMLIFQYGVFGKDELGLFHPSSLDTHLHAWLRVLVEGSFMPIFMFLFGYSLYKSRMQLERAGLKTTRVLSRRFLLLIAFGLLHAIFLWEGDILLAYGIMGFVLLLFVRRKATTMMIWGTVLSLLFIGMGYGEKSTDSIAKNRMEQYVEQSQEVMAQGSYSEIMQFRLNEDPLDLPVIATVFMFIAAPLIMAPMFLFGMAAASKGWFHNPRAEQRRYRRMTLLLLPAGLIMKTAAILWEGTTWSTVLLVGGGQLLALGILFFGMLLLGAIPNGSWIMAALEAVGRTSLTNYLGQTVLCIMIFNGYGLGWFGQAGVLAGIVLAVLIYVIQLVVSMWWLQRFRSGPLEKLLRIGTHWSWSGKPSMTISPKG